MSLDIVLSIPAAGWTFSAVVAINFCFARRDVHSKHSALEDLINGLGLICGNGMASLEDTRERHIALLANETAVIGGIGDKVGVSSCTEGQRSREIHGQRDVFSADP